MTKLIILILLLCTKINVLIAQERYTACNNDFKGREILVGYDKLGQAVDVKYNYSPRAKQLENLYQKINELLNGDCKYLKSNCCSIGIYSPCMVYGVRINYSQVVITDSCIITKNGLKIPYSSNIRIRVANREERDNSYEYRGNLRPVYKETSVVWINESLRLYEDNDNSKMLQLERLLKQVISLGAQ